MSVPDPWAKPSRRQDPPAGLDLHLDVARPGVRAGLERSLRDAVRTGRLAAGSRLPSSRTLAADLGIARNTVAEVYGQLVAEGWLAARRGAGTRVADRAPTTERPAGRLPGPSPEAIPAPPRFRYDLRPGSPDLASFPRAPWLAAARRALSAAPDEAFGYGDPRGRPELRRVLAEYLARVRGVYAIPDRVLVCSGYVQGLGLLCTALHGLGASTMAVEALGPRQHREVVAAHGLATVPVAVDDAGAVTTELPDVHAALLTPAHQFPTGVTLAAERRSTAVDWAREAGTVVVEDDYDGEFRYDRQPVGALQGLDPERVVYAGTASKSLAPGLRLAWLVLPPTLVEPVVEAKRLADLHTGTLDQLTLAELIRSGAYDRQIRRCRLRYRRRRDRLVSALAGHAPHVSITGIAAGLHALVRLPGSSAEEDALLARAAQNGLALEGLGTYDVTERMRPAALVVGYGTPPDHAYSGALDALGAVLRQP
jgi:GntR family transcriptional regulator / MocR family aminotransferase